MPQTSLKLLLISEVKLLFNKAKWYKPIRQAAPTAAALIEMANNFYNKPMKAID